MSGKYPRYPAYKDSGVEWLGDVPVGWKLGLGKRLFEQKRDPAFDSDDQLSATQKYGVIPQRLFMALEDQKVTLALAGTDGFKHINKNDFVISLRSFQGGIEWSKYSGCVSPAYTVLRMARAKENSPAFWAYLLKSSAFISKLRSVTEGIRDRLSGQPNGPHRRPHCRIRETHHAAQGKAAGTHQPCRNERAKPRRAHEGFGGTVAGGGAGALGCMQTKLPVFG